VNEVARRTGLEPPEAADAVEAMISAIRESVAKGQRVTLSGFGTFEKQRRAARLGRNPHTGEPVPIAATTVPSFRPGKLFREAVLPKRRKRTTRTAARRR